MAIEAPAVAIARTIQIDRVCRFFTNSTMQSATGLLSSMWSACCVWIACCSQAVVAGLGDRFHVVKICDGQLNRIRNLLVRLGVC